MSDCSCTRYYFFGQPGGAVCLHQLFAAGLVQLITRQVTRDGVEFYIHRDKSKIKRGRYAGQYWLNGWRSRLSGREQILLAIELSGKYKVTRVRL